jgi:hypothetical protein
MVIGVTRLAPSEELATPGPEKLVVEVDDRVETRVKEYLRQPEAGGAKLGIVQLMELDAVITQPELLGSHSD